jgi:hypothetical protein
MDAFMQEVMRQVRGAQAWRVVGPFLPDSGPERLRAEGKALKFTSSLLLRNRVLRIKTVSLCGQLKTLGRFTVHRRICAQTFVGGFGFG